MKDSSYWNVALTRGLNIYAVLVFGLMWIGFGLALILDRSWLGSLWNWTQALPPALRIIAWLIFTPVMVLLWAWESSWTALPSLLGFAGLIGWTALALVNFRKAFRKTA